MTAWKEMEKRFFFDRVDMGSNQFAIIQALKLSIGVLSYLAETLPAFTDFAVMIAKLAFNNITSRFPQSCFMHDAYNSVSSTSLFRLSITWMTAELSRSPLPAATMALKSCALMAVPGKTAW